MGSEVTIIEEKNIGGTCLNKGCIPSKIMKTTADLFLKFKEAENFGISLKGSFVPDLIRLMKRKQKIIDIQQKGILNLFKKSHIKFEKGRGFIKDKGLITIKNDDNKKDIAFDKLIIATGTEPLNILDFPFDGKTILSSNDLLELKEIPESIMIVGAGVIGCEFANILSALGSTVTIVEGMDRILPLFSVDESCASILTREMKKRKIKIITNQTVKKTQKNGKMLCVTLGDSPFLNNTHKKKIKHQTFEVEKMAVCIGRSPLSKKMGFKNISLKTDDKGWIPVNNKMETNIKGVYAIGDILGPSKIMLAHVASHEGMVAAENALGGNKTMNYNAVPSAIFTMPEIGNVGISEAQAIKQNIDIQCTSVNFRALGKAHVIGEIAGQAKIIAEKSNGKILGVHIIGPHATDLIAQATLAINKGMSVSDIANTIHAHPTLAEIMAEVSLKGSGIALHG
ncbi:MAG: dihydrolipoyl dehydrogenase [Desulfobacteraceae bacterium 4572_130]|nr:MAG: dihydrolipoyl dehydrogenase [Desulfobacteraceae bacterium 4572_130]